MSIIIYTIPSTVASTEHITPKPSPLRGRWILRSKRRMRCSKSIFCLRTISTRRWPHTSRGEICFCKAQRLRSNGTVMCQQRRSIFAFCAKLRLRYKQNAKHRPPLITPVLCRFFVNLGFFSYKVAEKHQCRSLRACTRKDT